MKNRLLAKADQLLRAVTFAETPPTLHELSEKLQIPLPTLGRLASDLVEMGLLAKEGYYHLVPSSGLAALGNAAKRHTTIVRCCAPLIQNYCSSTGMNAILAGMEYGEMFSLYECGGSKVTERTFWNSGGATLLFSASHEKITAAMDSFSRAHPSASSEAKLVFEREWEQVKTHPYRLHTNTMRQWSFSTLLTTEPVSVLMIHGKGPENSTPERFHFNASLLASKMRSLLGAEE